ncbi:MAG: hypothetical protein ISS25_01370 [Nanoarchaeota archaeon]|nr:hypothetical protein [DPANN group archaeon]MBL7116463.1 hypothetical protein [Nanoarchaeota archaeon]
MAYKKVLQYETFIVLGIIIAVLAFLNVLGVTNIDSDLFWALAGVGLIIEGFLERAKWRARKKRQLERDRKVMRK